MKKAIYATCSLILAAGLTACGEKKSEASWQPSTETEQTAASDEPYADPAQENNSTVTLGGHKYEVKVSREADKELPMAEDELGKKFYDNRVTVSITRDGAEFFSKSYTKEAFADFLTEAESKGTVLLGMAFDSDKSDAHAIYLGAQIGETGIGEGPSFTVEIPLSGGASSIMRDSEQDTTGDDGME